MPTDPSKYFIDPRGAGMAQWLSTCLPPMWPGFDCRTQRHMWVEFVVGSRPCSERFFSRYSGFPLSSKTNISKFQFDLESEGHKFISLGLLHATLVKQRLFIYFTLKVSGTLKLVKLLTHKIEY